tara:strand:- start:126 stop:584 length:459 start_codon:yes stop_codon:yes gene_type:complete
MQGYFARNEPRAYTLIEVLAVVVLMGLVAAVFVPSLARASRASQIERLKADLIQMDASARQLAVQGSLVVLRMDAVGKTIRLYQRREQPQIVQSISIPERFTVESFGFEDSVVFDAHGQSQGYGYLILSEGSAQRIEFNGLSGWYEVQADAQ